jgi:bacterioferritin B
MPARRFVEGLNAEIEREFAASQQYLAMGLHYDRHALPRLAAFFYRQALEERDHGLMMARYLLDSDEVPLVGSMDAPRSEFDDAVAPIALALEQEREVTGYIDELMTVARDERDYASEQFIQWFVKEQVEEVSTMSQLLMVAERCRDDLMELEEYVERELAGAQDDDPTAPPVVGA